MVVLSVQFYAARWSQTTGICILHFLFYFFIQSFFLSSSYFFFGISAFSHFQASDFRQNCRTFFLNPLVRFYYWQMNWHIEHHMYANVPCYNLARLHVAIETDLPPTPDGLYGIMMLMVLEFKYADKKSLKKVFLVCLFVSLFFCLSLCC
jgi:fatty acid desaturase